MHLKAGREDLQSFLDSRIGRQGSRRNMPAVFAFAAADSVNQRVAVFFRHPKPPLPLRDDGRFDTIVKVMDATEIWTQRASR
jgi:hypothetical protein